MKKKSIDKKNLSSAKSIDEEARLATLRDGAFCSELTEPTPTFVKAACEAIYSGKNNNYIVMGRDRPSKRSSGYGGSGDTQASMIDVVVGRMSYIPMDDVYVDPDFINDSARIYISQKTDVDANFNITEGSVGNSTARSAIGMKADSVRILAREGIKLVTRMDETNSQGANISDTAYGIDLIAGNDGDSLQPIPKGTNLVAALKKLTLHVHKLNGIVQGLMTSQDKLNKALKDHWHMSPFNGRRTSSSPTVKLVAAQTILRTLNKSTVSLRLHRTNLENFEKHYLSSSGAQYINSIYNKVN